MNSEDSKIVRFLKSINIENYNDFDMDFTSISKSKVDKNSYIYNIKKETPWKYNLLEEFLNGLNNITTYSYVFYFNYTDKPTSDDVIDLIKHKYFATHFHEYNQNINVKNNTLILEGKLSDGDITSFADDINSILSLIGYNFHVEDNRVKEEKEVIQDKKDERKVFDEEINKDFLKDKEEAESRVVQDVIDNYNKMIADRKRKELYKKSDDYAVKTIKELDSNSGAIDINGKVFEIENKETKKGFIISTILIADEEDAIYAKFIVRPGTTKEAVLNSVSVGKNIRILGKIDVDKYKGNDIYIVIHNLYLLPDDPLREDNAEVKRVELHLHTNMSDMDGLTKIGKYCELAKYFGHKAIAVTDHGVVQAFPEAQDASFKYGIKIIYGSELYMIDDYFKGSVKPRDIDLKKVPIVCFDLESTGLNIRYDHITEIGAVKFVNGMITERYDQLVNPGIDINDFIAMKTKISNDTVKDCPKIKEVLPSFLKFIEGCVIISHNIEFDYNMLSKEMEESGFGSLNSSAIDTLQISRFLNPENVKHSLGAFCKRFDVVYDEESAHRADYDAQVLGDVWLACQPALIKKLGKENYDLYDLEKLPIEQVFLKHWNRGGTHVTVLAKNKVGLKNLYKIISFSHIEHMGVKPFTPKSLLEKYKEGLLIGSACANGEIFYCAFRRSNKSLYDALDFYDYIELQPLENYSYLVNNGTVNSLEDLKKNILDIIKACESKNKIICATGDCHYLNPSDKKYRDIYIESSGVGGTFHPLSHFKKENINDYYPNPDQHFRTTQEMLDCFEWLGKDKAYEYVVTNTNKINDLIETFNAVPTQLATPTIDNCDVNLRNLCYNTAHELYGDPLPELIEKRLKRELDGIIDHGYAVTYYIAYELVKRTNEAGYIVGSRGSVGSSFAATMAKITEVNPLPPHYRCPKCKHVEFIEDRGKYKSGFDLPDKKCPNCGEDMIGDGQDIPFETFLGFNADKVPDIDLNFPTDFQATAHGFTKDLLGEDKVYRAGTIGAVQFKTAYGYVKNYFESFEMHPRTAWIAALAYGCTEVKRTTGQHPGGIVVIPRANEVYDFCPIQYPAGDTTAAWKTTHFDFGSIHDTILKLDMLGHVDPQALKMLTTLTHIDTKDIPLRDPKVLSLFTSDEALNMQHKYMKPDNGAIGLPEFGTENTRQVLRETMPRTFNDLLIISGLTHGTDVYGNNQQDLIKQGLVTLQDVIGCRDDIMTYLIRMGVPNLDAFKIMELVRKKDKHLTPEYIELMRSKGVPEFYIQACEKIQYLFPRGHACAYVIMALRVGYFKVYHPLEFYASFFTLRADDYDIVAMVKGIDAIHARIVELQEKKNARDSNNAFSKKDGDILECLKVALEMAERGYKFLNIDLYKSDSKEFLVDHERNALIPPFKVLAGFGEAASQSIIEARKVPFTSKKDLEKRGGINSTNLKDLEKIGVLDNLKDDDSITLFDFSF